MAILSAEQALPRLREAHQEGRLVPFLGAGFSIPLRLPSWADLVRHAGQELSFEPDLFALHGTSPQLLSYYMGQRHDGRALLAHWMTRHFDAEGPNARRRASPTHQAFAALDWHSVYTTNYDHHVEEALRDAGKPVAVCASLEDFQAPRVKNAAVVVKFHGTLAHSDSLVLGEADYMERYALDHPVDQRFRSDLLSNGFLFLGYSLRDANIRYLFWRMNRLRSARGVARRSYLATFGPDEVQAALLHEWNIDLVALDPVDKNAAVEALLRGLE